MNLISNSYFVGDIALPNLDEVVNSFDNTIERYEEEVMRKLLGTQLYDTFKTIVDAGTPYPAPWDDFINGAEFTFEFNGNTIVQKWNGLVNSDLISLISYYIYYQYRYENLSTTTSINDVQGISENSIKVNDARKMVYAWNKGLRLYGEFPGWNFFNKYDTVYEFYTDEPSAFNFLNANRVDFADWVFDPLNRHNEFGI
jgi:hypothetical protein